MPQARLDSFLIEYENKTEYTNLRQELFAHHSYYFETNTSDPVIIDAGAHIGLATLYFKKQYPAAHIWAVEPQPQAFQLLETNCSMNHLTNVTLLPQALWSESNTKLTLATDAAGDWLSTTSIVPGAWTEDQLTKPLEVSTLSLADLVTQITTALPDTHIDVLKLDVEGAESVILQAAQQHPHQPLKRVNRIFCEYHPTHQQLSLLDLLQLLEKAGFSSLSCSHKGKEVDPKTARGLIMIEAVP